MKAKISCKLRALLQVTPLIGLEKLVHIIKNIFCRVEWINLENRKKYAHHRNRGERFSKEIY